MRTEADLRAAFTVLEDHAPTECSGLVDEPRVQSRTRRFAPLAAVVAVVAAVAIAVPLLVSGTHPSGPSTQTTPPPPAVPEQPTVLRYAFTVDDVPGYTITLHGIYRDFQQADVAIGSGTGTNGPAGAIYVYRPSAFDPTAAKRGRPIKVDGHAGYFAKLPSPTLGYTGSGDPVVLDAVVWQYAPNAWAMVQADFRDLAALRGKAVSAQAEELKLARAVRTRHPHTLRVPFRFGYLPKGLVAEGAAPEQDGVWIYLGDGRPGLSDSGFGSALSVWVYGASDPDGVFCANQHTKTFQIDGRGGCFVPVNRKTGDGGTSGLYLNVKGGLVEMLVDNKHVGIYSDEQLKRIATSLQLATIRDLSTWFDATTAMPR